MKKIMITYIVSIILNFVGGAMGMILYYTHNPYLYPVIIAGILVGTGVILTIICLISALVLWAKSKKE